MTLTEHAKTELALLMPTPDEEQAEMNAGLLRLVECFASEGHSGGSAGYAIAVLQKLLRFEPLCPLTGEPGEWVEVNPGCDGSRCWQNKRCSRVFRREDGSAYDINGIVFEEPNGVCFTSAESHVEVTFPYVPDTIYVKIDRKAQEAP